MDNNHKVIRFGYTQNNEFIYFLFFKNYGVKTTRSYRYLFRTEYKNKLYDILKLR